VVEPKREANVSGSAEAARAGAGAGIAVPASCGLFCDAAGGAVGARAMALISVVV
jgi:hypothetical protein